MGPKHTKRSGIATFWGACFLTFFGFGQYFGRTSGFEIFKITMGFTRMSLIRFFWYVLDPFWGVFLVKMFSFCPIVKSMIYLYKLNKRDPGQIYFQQL